MLFSRPDVCVCTFTVLHHTQGWGCCNALTAHKIVVCTAAAGVLSVGVTVWMSSVLFDLGSMKTLLFVGDTRTSQHILPAFVAGFHSVYHVRASLAGVPPVRQLCANRSTG